MQMSRLTVSPNKKMAGNGNGNFPPPLASSLDPQQPVGSQRLQKTNQLGPRFRLSPAVFVFPAALRALLYETPTTEK